MFEYMAVLPVEVAHWLPPPNPEPQADALAETVPSVPTCRQRVEAPFKPETIRFVVDATAAVIMVVEAYGNDEAVEEVAMK